MSHRPNAMALQCRRSALGPAGLRRFDWVRSPAVAACGGFDRRGARAL